MSKRDTKPTKASILEQFELCKIKYGELQNCYQQDEDFYELNFKEKLELPDQFSKDGVVLPTARDVVDTGVNHTNIFNARVKTIPKGDTDQAKKSAEILKKFCLGVIQSTNIESSIAPAHSGAKHYWINGLAVFKTIWDVDRWVDTPQQKDGESEEEYAKRLDEWRASQSKSLPIIIQAVNPYHIMPDPYTGGDYYIIEWHKRKLYDVKRMYPNLKIRSDISPDEEIETFSYWTDKYRAEFVDNSPVLRGVVIEHGYGFNPYTLIETGLGHIDKENTPEKRYVGLVRYMQDLIISESMNYSLHNILMKRETLKGGYVTGADAATVAEVKQEYGKYYPVGDKDVEFHDWESNIPPEASARHLALTQDYIASHAAPRSARGLSEIGVRSGADRRLIIAEAAAIYQYATPAFQHGWAQILKKCAMLVKNKIPGDFDIWTSTPEDEFNVIIKKEDLKEPFNIAVEFAPISPEDEYRRHEDYLRLLNGGVANRWWIREKMPNMSPDAMEKQDLKEQIKYSPQFIGMIMQHVLPAIHEALQQAGLPMAINPNNPMDNVPPEAQSQESPFGAQGRGTTSIPRQPLSAKGQQGQGGGGNTLYGV